MNFVGPSVMLQPPTEKEVVQAGLTAWTQSLKRLLRSWSSYSCAITVLLFAMNRKA